MYPCDEQEQDRMDIYHKLFTVARNGELTLAPPPGELHQNIANGIEPHGKPRILDLGCGTGIWALDMAKKYPGAHIVGVDLANMQPQNVDPNLVRFQVPWDFESPWTLGENSWDLIHLQMGCGSVSSWRQLYRTVFDHLRPGGYFEQVEIDLEPQCDDGTLPDGPIKSWYQHLKGATERAHRPIAYRKDSRYLLHETDFVDIHHSQIRLPLNPWPTDPHQKEIGRWYYLGLSEGLEALSLGPFVRCYEWPEAHVRKYAKDVRETMFNKKIHAYNTL